MALGAPTQFPAPVPGGATASSDWSGRGGWTAARSASNGWSSVWVALCTTASRSLITIRTIGHGTRRRDRLTPNGDHQELPAALLPRGHELAVARAGHLVAERGQDGQLPGGEGDVKGSDVLLEPLHPLGARDRGE